MLFIICTHRGDKEHMKLVPLYGCITGVYEAVKYKTLKESVDDVYDKCSFVYKRYLHTKKPCWFPLLRIGSPIKFSSLSGPSVNLKIGL